MSVLAFFDAVKMKSANNIVGIPLGKIGKRTRGDKYDKFDFPLEWFSELKKQGGGEWGDTYDVIP